MQETTDRRWDRVGAASGIANVVLTFVGFGLIAAAVGATDLASSREEIAHHFADPAPSLLWVGGFLEWIGILLFVPFGARLAGAFRGHDPADWLPSTVFGAALLFVATGIVSLSAGATAYVQAGALDPAVAATLAYIRSFAFTLGWGVGALFLAAVASLVLTRGVLPRWLGWAAGVLAFMLLVSLTTPKAEFAQTPPMLMGLWILAASVALLRLPRPAEALDRVGTQTAA
jgi:hypothetical protein